MASFDDGFWDLFIIIVTLASLFGLWAFVQWGNKGRPSDGGKVETMGHVWDEDLAELNNPLPRWWLNMFLLTIVFAFIYLILYPGLGANTMVLGWSQQGQYEAEMKAAEERYGPLFEQYAATPIPELAKDPDALKMGERLFASYCTQCHGSDAGGVRGFPNLRDDDWLWGGTPEKITETILKGRNAMMPSWASLGDETSNLVQYLLSFTGRATDQQAAEAGKKQFAQTCAACHGVDAKGNQALGAPNLTDDIWLYGGTPRAIEETLKLGRKGRMPAHGEFLGEAKVHLLATYVYSLSRK